MKLRLRASCLSCLLLCVSAGRLPAQQGHRYLYAAQSNDTGSEGAVRILVFDIQAAHRLVRQIVLWPASNAGDQETVRGMAASSDAGRLFLSTTRRLAAIDTSTGGVVWENSYEDHCCDRPALSPDGRTIYAPAFGSPKWFVVNAATGELRTAIGGVQGWPRETVYSPDGRLAYLGAWESTSILVVDTSNNHVVRTVGPFSGSLCPFTLNPKGTLAFANVDGLVGFEVGDVQTGLVLDSVAVDDVEKSTAAEYECPSHGIEFTRDTRELWVADGVRNRLHVFDATVYPPVLSTTVRLADQPRGIAFSADGRYAYASTGDIIDAKTKKLVGALVDREGRRVSSTAMLELDGQ